VAKNILRVILHTIKKKKKKKIHYYHICFFSFHWFAYFLLQNEMPPFPHWQINISKLSLVLFALLFEVWFGWGVALDLSASRLDSSYLRKWKERAFVEGFGDGLGSV
jgi:hypothetical protein